MLQIGDGGAGGSIVGNVVDNATLAFDRSTTYTFDGAISGSGAVQQNGTGFTVLTGTNTYTGGTTISDGELHIGSGGTVGSIVGNVVDNGILTFDRSNSYTFAGVISGSGDVHKDGAGTTVLTGANTYAGDTVISLGAGALQIGSGGTTGSIVGDVINNSTLAIDRSNSFTYVGDISGTGGVQQNGAGTTILTGSATHIGGTIINAGTLQIGNGSMKVGPTTGMSITAACFQPLNALPRQR